MTEMQTTLPRRESKGLSFFKSRRDLTGSARSIADKFACSLQHYAWLARHYGIASVTVDLLTPRIFPEPFDIERNRILVAMCRQNLDDLLKRLPPAGQGAVNRIDV